VSKSWANFHFWVNYPFNLSSTHLNTMKLCKVGDEVLQNYAEFELPFDLWEDGGAERGS